MRFTDVSTWQNRSRSFLAIILGYAFGYILFRYSDPRCVILVSSARQPLTALGLLFSLFMPLVITILFLHYRRFRLLYCFLFIKSMLYCFTGCFVMLGFPNGALLVRLLAFFSENVGMFVLVICAFFYKPVLTHCLFYLFFVITVIGAFDYFKISPIISDILSL